MCKDVLHIEEVAKFKERLTWETHHINTIPSIGDTVFVNRVGSGGGVWVVLKEGNLQ